MVSAGAQPSLYKLSQQDAYVFAHVITVDKSELKVKVAHTAVGNFEDLKEGRKLTVEHSGQSFVRASLIGHMIGLGLVRKGNAWLLDEIFPDSHSGFHVDSPTQCTQLSPREMAEGVALLHQCFELNAAHQIDIRVSEEALKQALDSSAYLQLMFEGFDLYHRLSAPPSFSFWITLSARLDSLSEPFIGDSLEVVPRIVADLPTRGPSFFVPFVQRTLDGTISDEYLYQYDHAANQLIRAFHFEHTAPVVDPTAWIYKREQYYSKKLRLEYSNDPWSSYSRIEAHFTPPFADGSNTASGAYLYEAPGGALLKGTFVNGVANGRVEQTNDRFATHGNCTNGKPDGTWHITTPDQADTLFEVTYSKGLREGAYTLFGFQRSTMDRPPLITGHYQADLPIGEWIIRSAADHALYKRVIFTEDSAAYVDRNRTSNPSFDEHWPYELSREVTTYYPNERVRSNETWDGRLLQHKTEWFYWQDETYKAKCEYRDGEPYSGEVFNGIWENRLRMSVHGAYGLPERTVTRTHYKMGVAIRKEVVYHQEATGSYARFQHIEPSKKRKKAKRRNNVN